jgi:mannitol/fructose-specific phosphotransferase system IIA component (Ntr-type)
LLKVVRLIFSLQYYEVYMQRLVNHLSQLQELVLIRDEHRATGDGSHMKRLNDSIDQLTDKLPRDVKSLYIRLYKKNHIVMAPMYNGCCSICGMRLPVSMVQSVRICKNMQNCPSCARILFEESDAPHWVGEKMSRATPSKSGISRFSAETLMLPGVKANNAAEAITALANLMADQSYISNPDKLIESALEREAVLSTAMERSSIAFPHVRGVEGGGLTMAMATSKEGFVFDGEGSKVNIVFFMTIPAAVSAFYLRLMAGLTESLSKEQNRKALLSADSPVLLWKTLCKATRYTVK